MTAGKFSLMPFFLALAGNAQEYAGSKACATCHAAIARSYSATPMAMSSGRPESGVFSESLEQARFLHEPSRVEYRVSREEGKLALGFSRPGGELNGRRALDYFIGSGAAGRSYLTLINGFLFQSPVSYYSKAAKWDISPGYQTSKDASLTRAIEIKCLQCHSGRWQPVEGTQNRYGGDPFLEAGIGCERCHGPGAKHASSPPAGIVNPAKLDARRRDSVCAQCHLTGDARIARAGRGLRTYRPGDLLSDHVVSFIRPASTVFRVTSHYETLAQSACGKASRGKLWCGTCHDAHSVPAPAESASYFRARCLGCHEPARCDRGPDCAGCHMPKNPTADVGHVAYTDHAIARRPTRLPAASPPSSATLVPYWNIPAAPRELGLAYAEIGQPQRALDLLREAKPNDAEALAQLGSLYERKGDAESAIANYERAVKLDPALVNAVVNLGILHAKQGRLADAARLFAGALERSEGFEAAGVNLGVALARLGRFEEAKAAFRKTLEYNPDSAPARKMLAEIR
jgi:predicted CXXCH cytochrome family protein